MWERSKPQPAPTAPSAPATPVAPSAPVQSIPVAIPVASQPAPVFTVSTPINWPSVVDLTENGTAAKWFAGDESVLSASQISSQLNSQAVDWARGFALAPSLNPIKKVQQRTVTGTSVSYIPGSSSTRNPQKVLHAHNSDLGSRFRQAFEQLNFPMTVYTFAGENTAMVGCWKSLFDRTVVIYGEVLEDADGFEYFYFRSDIFANPAQEKNEPPLSWGLHVPALMQTMLFLGEMIGDQNFSQSLPRIERQARSSQIIPIIEFCDMNVGVITEKNSAGVSQIKTLAAPTIISIGYEFSSDLMGVELINEIELAVNAIIKVHELAAYCMGQATDKAELPFQVAAYTGSQVFKPSLGTLFPLLLPEHFQNFWNQITSQKK